MFYLNMAGDKFGYGDGEHDITFYEFDTIDDDYKLWKSGQDDDGFYRVSVACFKGAGADGKKGCSLEFRCTKSYTADEPFDDC